MDQTNSPVPPAMQLWLTALSDDLERRKRDHLFRTLSPVAGAQGTEITIGSKRYLQFCTNNYLGLAADIEVIDAARGALDRWGFGSGASRLVAGSMESHHELEADLAEFKHTDAALVFASGYAANMAVLTTFAGSRDRIFSDKLNHASLLDAASASGARSRTFQHRNYQRLTALLEHHADHAPIPSQSQSLPGSDLDSAGHPLSAKPGPQGRTWIVTDTVFSMDGDLADMAALGRIARQNGAFLVTDEAHATGVLGPDGRGVAAMAGAESEIAVSVGTLSKALGSMGGFVTGPREAIETLVNRSRQFIYTTALPAACTAAARTALQISRREPHRRMRVLSIAAHVRKELTAMGYATGGSESPIIPVMLGSAQQAMEASAWLREQGLFIPAIRPPTVAANTARLRISLMATHTDSQITRLLSAVKELRNHLPQ